MPRDKYNAPLVTIRENPCPSNGRALGPFDTRQLAAGLPATISELSTRLLQSPAVLRNRKVSRAKRIFVFFSGPDAVGAVDEIYFVGECVLD